MSASEPLAGGSVGKPVPRPQARQFVRGRGRYTDDLRIAGTLHAVFLRSPYAHARIDAVDLDAARKAPGVVAAFDGAAIGKVCPSWTTKFATMPNHRTVPQPPLAIERALWQGQPVAIVIAESRALGEDALGRIAIEWSELEPLADPLAAMSAPPLHPELGTNIAFELALAVGDPARVFAGADRVVRRRLKFARHTGVPLEARSILAEFDPALRRLTVYQSTQVPHQMRAIYADLLGLSEADIRVVVPDVGGAFGVKLHLYDDEITVVAASMLLGRPVKFVSDRLEAFVADIHARAQTVEAALAVKQDGTVLGFEVDDIAEIGAYSLYPRTSVGEGLQAITMTGAPYSAPALRGRLRSVFQNKAMVGSYRGVGQPIACGITEFLIDAAAAELGIDPAEMRRRNYRRPGIDPSRTAGGIEVGDLSHRECLERMLQMMDYQRLRAEQAAQRKAGRYLGIGFAAFVEMTAPGTGLYGAAGVDIACSDGCTLRLEPSGMATCITSATEQGQGADTGIAQLVADTLGLPFDHVRLVAGDTGVTPVGGGTWASRGLVVGGEAALQAANALRDRLLGIAAALLKVERSALVLSESAVHHPNGKRELSLAELGDMMHFRQNLLPAGVEASPMVTAHSVPRAAYLMANGIQASLVQLDPELGVVKPLRHWVVEDCGRVINPLLADEQIRGGVIQGLGAALFEECRYDEHGQLQNATLADYLVPSASDMPDIVVDHVCTPVSGTLLGAKGLGEAGTIGSAAAFMNALNDALRPHGCEIAEIPCTPERILRALKRVP
jgi:carbon-monoxide dehydrogenase large subunit